ncbi:KDEL endoplasmic reticulum protein retention receptor 1 [Phyllostomus discolor]|uniref:ER lumen protein-retaining receptor n=1 Tax=Phyllostomus discolor TaxID=89673 RepID=A0A834DFB8_9CHIR|nr:KDEL endoplasmic reticulum protein retention receptor 1 [Phyllostomus discolor]
MLRWKLGPGHCGGCRGVLLPPRPRGDPPPPTRAAPLCCLSPGSSPHPVHVSSPASPWLIRTPPFVPSAPPPPPSVCVSVCLSVWVTSEASGDVCACVRGGRRPVWGTACPFSAWPPPDHPPRGAPTLKPRQKHTHTHHLTSLGFPSTPPELEKGDTHAHAGGRWGPGCHCRQGLCDRQEDTQAARDARRPAGRRQEAQSPGISGKSQVLFAVVFTARYLDLFTNYISLYNTCMKVVYIACSFTTVWMIYSKFKATYDGNHDTFRVEFLVVPTAILAFLVNHDFTPLEILWTFSIYLESVAILPQLFMVSKTGEAETITSHYLFALGVYRTLYLFNWIWRYHFEGFFDLIAIVAGLVQTVLYCDFFYLYITKVLKGKKLSLPA